ncbi:hypothetical protein [Bacillus sp. CECT 9360]|uniref:hypothetical protein n=1 Tax=Bacillus sp. CECT 9360 TaxID=2845821 RepID=UPI001E3EE196|nr:hypothetical protein [Bacillus sp. CECT 9360]CAH0345449.1 hypothetical protein BCI9360_01735 [Bacillus sp. CECT 9360]
MSRESLYFTDNFFSAGRTEIYNESKEKVGELDLKSVFSSGVDVLDSEGNLVISAKFPVLRSKWKVYDNQGQEIGVLKQKFTFFAKKYEYHAYERGSFLVKSEAFSKQYEIYKAEKKLAATFAKISGFFSSPTYQLQNYTDELPSEELIAIVMGINAIEKNNTAAAST